jgi:hypothetical protein
MVELVVRVEDVLGDLGDSVGVDGSAGGGSEVGQQLKEFGGAGEDEGQKEEAHDHTDGTRRGQ